MSAPLRIWQYLMALAVVVGAVGLRWVLDPGLGMRLTLVPMVIVLLPLVLLVRPGPFLLAALVGWVSTWIILVEPRMSLEKGSGEVVVALLTLLGVVLAVVTARLSARAMRQREESVVRLQEAEALMRATFDNAAVGIGHVGLDGSWLRFNDRMGEILRKSDGVPSYMVVVVSDSTERKHLDSELKLRSEQFETLIKQAPIGVFMVDADFRISQVNPRAEVTFEGSGRVIGRDFGEVMYQLWPAERAAEVVRIFRHTLETGEAFHVPEYTEVRKDRGVAEYYDYRVERLWMSDGRNGVVCYFRDISKEVNARMAVTQTRERYGTLFSAIQQGFCLIEVIFDEKGVGVDYRFLEANPAFERHTGLVNAVDKTIVELVPRIENQWIDFYAQVVRTGEPSRLVQGSAAMGRWFEVEAFRVGEAGQRRVAVLFTDISARKQAEDALRDSEERLRIAIEAADLGVWDWDMKSGQVTRSLRHDQFFGYDELQPEWTFPIAMQHVVPEDRVIAVRAHEGALLSNVVSYQVRVRWADGSIHWVAVHGHLSRDEEGNPERTVGVVAEITTRMVAEEALRESERRARARADELAALVDMVPAAVLQSHDPYGRRITGSRNAHELMHMPAEEDFSPGGEPGAAERFRMFQNGAELAPEDQPLQRAARGQRMEDQELELRFDDGSVRYLFGNAVPIFDERGSVRGALAAMIDITERKRAEGALLEADRRKDEFLATLAHELRNPLAAIRMAISVLDKLGGAGQAAATTAIIDRQLSQLVRLIDDLLDVSRISRGKIGIHKTRLDAAALIEQVVNDARPMAIEAGLELIFERGAEELWVEADTARFTQVVNNLLHNACKFTEPGGKVEVRVERDGGEVLMRVRDTGIGIDPERLEEVFEMFSQADEGQRAGGLGIGLSLAKSIMQLHGGSISAQSAGAARGSEFLVRLAEVEPLDGEGRRLDNPEGDLPACPESKRILAADDNSDALSILAVLLRISGHLVTTAVDGTEALEKARLLRPEITLLDIGMPGMNGYEVARQIRREAWGQEMVLVAMTGWGQDKDKQMALDAGFDYHLTKPVAPKVLEALIAMGRRAGAGAQPALAFDKFA